MVSFDWGRGGGAHLVTASVLSLVGAVLGPGALVVVLRLVLAWRSSIDPILEESESVSLSSLIPVTVFALSTRLVTLSLVVLVRRVIELDWGTTRGTLNFLD